MSSNNDQALASMSEASAPSLGGLIRDGARGSFRNADPALRDMRERIVHAQSRGEQLLIEGHGSKRFYGEALSAGGPVSALSVSAYSGIVAYEPTELVITAKCGTPLAEVEAALDESGQMLAFEPPRFPVAGGAAGGTIGGVVATGLSGPRRVSAGAARDFVLGAALVDASGNWMQFGGTVMKNVAGYDVARLLCGSMGIFGVIAEVSLKVLPKPAAEQTVQIDASMAQALQWLNEWGGQPLPIAASYWSGNVLVLRLAGASAAVERASKGFVAAQAARVLGAEQAALHWGGLRDQTMGFFGEAAPDASGQRLWRVSLPGTAPQLVLDGEQVIEWGGALRWCFSSAPAGEVRAKAEALGGTAMLYRGAWRADETGVAQPSRFHPLSAPLLRLHQRLKAELDPRGVFNPSRMYPGL